MREVHKGFNHPTEYAELIAALHARGIALMGTFVFGLDDDGPEVFDATTRFAIETRIDLPRYAILTPFPGTALFRRLEAEGRILTRDWELYDGQHVVFRPARMSVEALEAGSRRAWRQTYSAGAIPPVSRLAGADRALPRSQSRLSPLRPKSRPVLYLRLVRRRGRCVGDGGRPGGRGLSLMRLTIVHPCIGRHAGDRSYMRSWQMQPLPPAMIAGLTPADVEIRFWDDRMEVIPYDEPTDLVAISVETYTARRSYQIASEFRRRGVPVAMGGFHAMLCPDEVARYADIVVEGEAEDLWPGVVEDVRAGHWKHRYAAPRRPRLGTARPDRRIFQGKNYLNLHLVEAGRGCHFRCDFCAIQSAFGGIQTRRPVDTVLDEIRSIGRPHDLYFFVDDNITSNLEAAKEFYRALDPARHPLGVAGEHQRRP